MSYFPENHFSSSLEDAEITFLLLRIPRSLFGVRRDLPAVSENIIFPFLRIPSSLFGVYMGHVVGFRGNLFSTPSNTCPVLREP